MARNLLIILIFLFNPTARAQNDPAAIKILDSFSASAANAPSVSLKFMAITANSQDNTKDTVSGSLLMQKNQYRLELPDNITWFNGTVSWNYLVREKEVTIVKPDKKEDSFFSRPSSVFTMYKKGYKTRLVEDNAKSYIIDLYPEDVNSDMIRIRLAIGKTLNDLVSAEYKRKDGITVTLRVSDYSLKKVPDAAFFTFNPKNYKGVEIIDMR